MSRASIYKEIMRDYERIRTEENARLKMHQEAVYKTLPRVKEIEEEISLCGVSMATIVLKKPADYMDKMADIREKMTSLKKEKKSLLEKNGFDGQFLTMQYRCEKCKDTGYIGAEKCSCFQQRFVDKAYSQSNIKDITKSENFDFFDFRYYSTEPDAREGVSPRENMKLIYNICLNFTHNFGREFSNLLLYGSTGLGKTFLCNCIAKELLDRGKTVLYVTAPQLFKLIEDEKFNRTEDNEGSHYLEDILSVDLFIIDDLGTEFSTILSSSELFHIINSRLNEKKPVILSTNLSPSDLINQYSDRIVSRIMGSYKPIKFFGDDIRVKKNFKNM